MVAHAYFSANWCSFQGSTPAKFNVETAANSKIQTPIKRDLEDQFHFNAYIPFTREFLLFLSGFFQIFKTLTMTANQSQTTKDVSSNPFMMIQSTNYQLLGHIDANPEGLQMLILALKHSVLSTKMFSAFDVPHSWLSIAASTATYSKTMQIVTFQLINHKKFRLTKKMFAQILKIPNVEPISKVTNAQIIHMFNEMGHQPAPEKISDFKKSGLPCIWNFMFGTYLCCLTGRTIGLNKGHLEVYTLVAGIYYDLQWILLPSSGRNFLRALKARM